MNTLKQKTLIKPLLASSLSVGLALANGAEAANLADTEVKFSGYIKVDAMYSDYSNGEGVGPGRDLRTVFGTNGRHRRWARWPI